MKCILMNKNVEVMTLEYYSPASAFIKLYNFNNIKYAPLPLSNFNLSDDNDEIIACINKWFKNRGIPKWRDNLKILLSSLKISSTDELLEKSYGLSLSDQYWIKPFDSKIEWKDINFFNHDFDSTEFLEASFTTKAMKNIPNPKSLHTPSNVLGGALKKAWIVDSGKRYLLKGSFTGEELSPFNEVLASNICERLGFNHVKYEISMTNNNIVSKCECFVNENTEFIPASQILDGYIPKYNHDDYEYYISILESNGIQDARVKMENIYVLDFLIENQDRHLNNFGIIRDVNTLKWIDVAPIYDNGQSLLLSYYDDEEAHAPYEGMMFYYPETFDEIIKVVKDITRIDIFKLDGVVDDYFNLLHQYQNDNHLSDNHINILCTMLDKQIKKINDFIQIESKKCED